MFWVIFGLYVKKYGIQEKLKQFLNEKVQIWFDLPDHET